MHHYYLAHLLDYVVSEGLFPQSQLKLGLVAPACLLVIVVIYYLV
jgi:hypothetical protein